MIESSTRSNDERKTLEKKPGYNVRGDMDMDMGVEEEDEEVVVEEEKEKEE